MQRDFAGLNWTAVSAELTDANFDRLSLLSPSKFVIYLPAFLLRALDCPGGLVWEFTFYALTTRSSKWMDERAALFSPGELLCILAYLEFVWLEC